MASEYLKWKYRDVEPDVPIVLTRKQKLQNLWHYYKWFALGTAILLVVLADVGKDALHIGEIAPDYRAAYVGSTPLDDETIIEIEAVLTSLGADLNDDGRTVAQLNSYVDMVGVETGDAAGFAYAAGVRITADLEACESYFFILSEPETFQSKYDILADANGELARRASDVYAVPLVGCPVFASIPGTDGLYIARRGFWQDRVCDNLEACNALWNVLTEGASL